MKIENMIENEVALITGGTAGIGKAIAKLFAEQGAIVVVFGTNTDRGKAAEKELQKIAGAEKALFIQCDVADHSAVQKAVNTIIEKFGKVDILVNNAGITRDKLLLKMSEEDWDNVIEINLKSCYNLCKHLARPMMKARRGKIINVSSVVGIKGNPGQLNYVSSKAGVIGFTKALAREIAPRGICVNCIAPGFIETEMTEELNEKQREQIYSQIPLGKMGSVLDVAQAALFLACPLSSYITGHVLTVDGGMAM